MLPGRGDLAVAHDVEVLARALAHVAVGVEQDRLFIPRLQRLDLCQHAVEVLPRRLRVRNQRIGADPPPGGNLRAHTVALALLAEVGAPLPAGDRHVDGSVQGVQAHMAVAAIDDRADVARPQPVARDQLESGGAQLLERVRRRHVVELRRAQQALDVVGPAEDRRTELGLVATHAVEHARAVVQPVREDVDLGVLPGDEIAVHPNEIGWVHWPWAPLEVVENRPARPPRARVTAKVGRAQPSVEDAVHSRFYSRGLACQAESVLEHHRRGQEHRQRVGDPTARDVRRRAVHRLE